jgi:hypothetical protein
MVRHLLLGLLFVVACKKPIDLKKDEAAYDAYLEALPELRVVPRDKPVLLSVVYVENPHLPKVDIAARQRVYAAVESLAKRVYGFDLKITELRQQTIADFFERAAPRFAESPIRYPAEAFLVSWFAPTAMRLCRNDCGRSQEACPREAGGIPGQRLRPCGCESRVSAEVDVDLC